VAFLAGRPSARFRGVLHTLHSVSVTRWAVNAKQLFRQQSTSFVCKSTLDLTIEFRR